jgi:hypothetical protein
MGDSRVPIAGSGSDEQFYAVRNLFFEKAPKLPAPLEANIG